MSKAPVQVPCPWHQEEMARLLDQHQRFQRRALGRVQQRRRRLPDLRRQPGERLIGGGHRQQSLLATAAHGGQQQAGLVADQNQGHARPRLFQGLEQRVLRTAIERFRRG